MRTVWKIVLVLALVLPTGAFVAGSIAASSADRPGPRHTIVIRDDDSRSATPSPHQAGPSSAHSVDHGDVEVVTPPPGDLRDDHGGIGGGHGSDGGSRHGSGGGGGGGTGTDDSGGHGGGHG